MSNDLISREALKDEFEELCKTHCGLKKKDLCSITCPVLAFKETLANAPTVEQKYYERVVANITLDQNQLDVIAEKVKAEIGEDKGKKKCVDCEHALYLTKRDEELGLVGGCEIGFPCNDDSEGTD